MYTPLLPALTTIFGIGICLRTAAFARSVVDPRATSATPGKAGLAWELNGNTADIPQFQQTAKVSWYYTWSRNTVATSLEFVPMLWGQQFAADFASHINQTISDNNVKAILGMNEPDQASQSNLSPQQAAQLWRTNLEPLRALGVRLGSPAPSSATTGITWLQQFIQACAGCTIDFVALHFYSTDATQFIQHLQQYHNTFQRPLWVTEWACENFNGPECDPSDAASFLSQTQSFMDASDFVERYAWSGAMRGTGSDALLDASGALTSLGKQYIGA